ncbi:MAG: L-serine ammonia-lyase, iron-sulfur-dependent, subunit alpha, partial [Endomicrobium sp.]|nr:L-serine ammonia-lyase, iron-sulfur-dependent, subunit alpha [Endomicrobium sp.]
MSTKNLDKIITMSVFDLLKTGPGPSSSHTIAPMKAGYDFVQRVRNLDANILAKVNGVRVRLYGSLSATGKGHGTDRAVIAGLMGNEPSTCPPTLLNTVFKLPKEKKVLDLGKRKLPIGLDNIAYCSVSHNFPYNNTLVIDLLSKHYDNKSKTIPTDEPDYLEKNIIFSWEYYSVGGGFLQWKGWAAPKTVKVPYPYSNMTQLLSLAEKKGLSLDEVILQNEIAISGLSKNEINSKLNILIKIMKDTVARGIATEGVLPGPIGLKRKAKRLKDRSDSLQTPDRYICLLDAYAYAVAEENA